MSAIIAFPANVPAQVDWTPVRPAQVSRSEWTGKRKVMLLAEGARWRAKVAMPPIRSEAAFLAWRAFLADLEGVANRFRLIACEGAQRAGAEPTVAAAAAAGAMALSLTGFAANEAALKRGNVMTVMLPSGDEQLVTVTAPVAAAADGSAIVNFKPGLREAVAIGGAVETRRPWGLMAMTDDTPWSVGRGQIYTIAFECEESI